MRIDSYTSYTHKTGGFRCAISKGFTLVELAVVLVIIGIILGAVIKGNDLIENAKVKGVIQAPSKWEVPIMTFYDKKGYFPGDQAVINTGAKDGLITSLIRLKADLDAEGIAYPADTISDVTFDIQSYTDVCGNTGVSRNIMFITGVPTATAKQLDIAIDGKEDALTGRIRYCGEDGQTAESAWNAATTDPRAVTYFFDKTIP
ncbi:MAG: prepilin-type N-terminal cleavage/methylation domain-containing protein [Geobacter sp.]|nr:prepilin-type N-terminal cleavage/methylation domain-containing protein [Geobacter sp.]